MLRISQLLPTSNRYLCPINLHKFEKKCYDLQLTLKLNIKVFSRNIDELCLHFLYLIKYTNKCLLLQQQQYPLYTIDFKFMIEILFNTLICDA